MIHKHKTLHNTNDTQHKNASSARKFEAESFKIPLKEVT